MGMRGMVPLRNTIYLGSKLFGPHPRVKGATFTKEWLP